jgi:SNF2 family DNA or RNA helicase
LGTSNLFVVNPNQTSQDVVMAEARDVLKDKFENLQEILQAKSDGKFLIFSCYDSTFQKTEQLLNSLNQTFAALKGSHDVIASITRRYKTGDLNILLVNPKNYGSGLNLENTTDIIILHKFDTDIEHQVIGRAQRLGRETSLNVHYLLYENEITE